MDKLQHCQSPRSFTIDVIIVTLGKSSNLAMMDFPLLSHSAYLQVTAARPVSAAVQSPCIVIHRTVVSSDCRCNGPVFASRAIQTFAVFLFSFFTFSLSFYFYFISALSWLHRSDEKSLRSERTRTSRDAARHCIAVRGLGIVCARILQRAY